MFPLDIRILVVDDMMTMRKIVINGLKQIGFTKFEEANDGSKALPILEDSKKGEKFGLIVSDWNMPELTGIELLKKVRTDEVYKDLPFLMVTAEAEKSAVVQALEAKVSNYIIKPFNPETLRQKIELVYKKHFGAK